MFPPLLGVVGEARLNLAIYHLKQGYYTGIVCILKNSIKIDCPIILVDPQNFEVLKLFHPV